jgi:hypothetical protein
MDEIPLPQGPDFDAAYAEATAVISSPRASSQHAEDPGEGHGHDDDGDDAVNDDDKRTPGLSPSLREYLEAHHLLKLEQVLLSHGVDDMARLASLPEPDLRAMGIAKGPRVKLVRTIGDWQQQQQHGQQHQHQSLPSDLPSRAQVAADIRTEHVENGQGQHGQPREETSGRPVTTTTDLAAVLFDQACEIAGLPSEARTEPADPQPAPISHADIASSAECSSTIRTSTISSSGDADLSRLLSMGFDLDLARAALGACGGSMREAAEWALAAQACSSD